MPPLVSVLMPCRDAEETIGEAIASLEGQVSVDMEFVAVDDGSTDGTGDALRAWAGRDGRVTVMPGPGPGIAEALNAAAAAARGTLLARMDADDVCHPERLCRQVALLEREPGLAGCGTHVDLFPPGNVGPGYKRYEAWINAVESCEDVRVNALIECPVAHPTLVLRRSVLATLGGYRAMGWPEDYDLVLRIMGAGCPLANVPGPALLRWRVRPDRLSLVSADYDASAFRRCKVHFLRHSLLPADRPVVLWGAGRVGKPLAVELARQSVRVSGFVDLDPRKLGQTIHGAPVWSPEEFWALAPAGSEFAARPFVLAAVGSPNVRGEIRAALESGGFREREDFLFCA